MSGTESNFPPEWSKNGIRKEELPWTPAGFHYIDSDNDNLLTKDELINAYKEFDIQDRGKAWSDNFYDSVADSNLSAANLDDDAKTMSYGEAMFDAYGHEVNENNSGKSAEELERLRNNMDLNDFETKYGEDARIELSKYDDNGDGTLTKYEVRTGILPVEDQERMKIISQNLKKLGFNGSCDIDAVSSQFDSIDANKDNFLRENEVVEINKKMGNKMTMIEAWRAVNQMDLDSNHQASLGEIAYLTNSSKDIDLTTLTDDNVKNRLNEYDLDKNGIITKDEIVAHDKELDERNKRSDKSNGLSTGAIIGIIAGAICLIGLIVGLIVYFQRKKRRQQSEISNNFNCNDQANFNTNSIKMMEKRAPNFS